MRQTMWTMAAVCVLAGTMLAETNPVGPKVTEAPEDPLWKTVTVIDGLDRPWAVAWLGDGRMLITERKGQLRLAKDGELLDRPVKGLPEILDHGQGGLLDVSIHPDFAENGWVYLTYAAGTPKSNHTRLARGKLVGHELKNVKVLFEVNRRKSGGQHFGSRILWLPDKTFLMSIGDGGNPPVKLDGQFIRKQAQKLDSHLGSVLRMDEDGKAPKDNPFAGKEGALPRIFSYGHRNIQGLARDPKTGNIWASEHGPRGGDELNLIQAGANYAWPEATYGREYFGPKITEDKTLPGTVDPKAVWKPSIAQSGLAYYSANRIPGWQGCLFAGGLVGKQIQRIETDGQKVLTREKIDIGRRVRDVRQGPDGYLYFLTDEKPGQLVRFEPVAPAKTKK